MTESARWTWGAMGGLALGFVLACAGGDGGDTGVASGETEATLQLGDACVEDAACVSGQCAFGECREGCRDWAECVGKRDSRAVSCLYVPDMDVVQEFRPGACTTDTEESCTTDADCPSALNACDPNGICRAVCDAVDDCVNHEAAPVACAAGFCYDRVDSGWALVSVDQPVLEAPPVTARVVFDAAAVADPMACTVTPAGEEFDPESRWGWPFGHPGVLVNCHDPDTDAGLYRDDLPRAATVSFPIDPTVLGEGMTADDVGLCGNSVGCGAPEAFDAATSVVTWRHGAVVTDLTPMVVSHLSAMVGSDPLECWLNPDFAGTQGAYSLRSWPAGTAGRRHEDCWPGSFELRVVPDRLAVGTHDLSDPAVQASVEVGLEVDGKVYGLLEGAGTLAGASGTLAYTGTSATVFVRLTDVTLAADDGASVTIDEALLFVSN